MCSAPSPNEKEISNPRESESSSLLQETLTSVDSPEAVMGLEKCWSSSRRIQVDVLAGLFGIGSWLSVNAMFTQLAIFVESAPEGWNLPSYLSIVIQCANLGPILYSLSQKYCRQLISDKKLIYFILMLGTLSLILMAFLYDVTWTVYGSPHSVILCVLTFFIALVGCTSSVLFIPFMNNFPEVYLISYMVGEGLSGFVPSIISLIQGVGGNPSCKNETSPTGEITVVSVTTPPRFSSEIFFIMIFSIMAVSTISFYLLNTLPSCKKQKLKAPISQSPLRDSPTLDNSQEPEPFVHSSAPSRQITSSTYGILLLVQTVVSMFANGALPSVQSYSCLPYGNLAYHLAVNLSNMANPVACFLTFFVSHTSLPGIFLVFLLSGVSISYVLMTAFLSPIPPLVKSEWGIALIVLSWVACSGLIAYVKMSIAAVFRREGGRGLFWYGAVTQVGAAIGSVVMFYLINGAQVFTSYQACST